ncbi:ADP-ribosylglycohydrolase family protein [Salana multivorans]
MTNLKTAMIDDASAPLPALAPASRPRLTAAQTDRAAGVLLTAAVGDALGVPYEFAPPLRGEPRMIGGGLGPYAPGEYSDDTQMAVCIAEVGATGADLTTPQALDAIADGFIAWRRHGASDIGVSTRSVLTGAETGSGSAARLAARAERYLARTGRGGGNGGLMRTGVVGIASLADREHTARAARAVCELTHADPFAGDSCVLWSEAIRIAVLEGRFDVAGCLDLIPAERRGEWAEWVAGATGADPASLGRNGGSVRALLAAWAAITSTIDDDAREFPADHLRDALHAAVRAGDDTDTVAAIAGALLGARWGASAVPARYRRRVHGWPGLDAADMVRLGVLAARGGRDDRRGWPSAREQAYAGWSQAMAVPHPMDGGVLLGTINTPDHGCDAVVSLCRRGRDRGSVAREDQVDVWLLDVEDPAANQNLAFVLADTARAIRDLRSEGKTVFVHCVAAEQRMPSAAVAYARLLGAEPEEAQAMVLGALASARGRGRLLGCCRECDAG